MAWNNIKDEITTAILKFTLYLCSTLGTVKFESRRTFLLSLYVPRGIEWVMQLQTHVTTYSLSVINSQQSWVIQEWSKIVEQTKTHTGLYSR
jgi:hypothetical protein